MSITLSLSDRPVSGLSDSELLTRLDDIAAAERRLAAARLETVAELCTRGIPAAQGYARPAAFLREQLKCHPAAAAQMHRLASILPTLPEVADALAKAAISEAQAAVITNAVQTITAETCPDQQAQAAALLLAQAAVLAPRELAVCGNRILHHVAPETAEQQDRAHVESAERTAWQSRAFTLTPDGHGRVRLRGSTTAEGAALLHAILDPLTHPRHSHPDNSDSNHDGEVGTATHTSPSGHRPADSQPAGSRSADGGPELPAAFRDPRSAAQRRHDALLDALRLLLVADTLPDHGGSKPQIAVMVGLDALRGRLDGGLLDTGAAVSAAEARKLACDAGILPAVLDGHGVPLDLGRERRLITGGLRKALILRDRGCAWPGCDRAARWCHAHHVIHWSDGGQTCLANSVLVCGFHHRMIHHDDGWAVHIGADGHPWFTPPAHLDPQQTPRRNLYHQRD